MPKRRRFRHGNEMISLAAEGAKHQIQKAKQGNGSNKQFFQIHHRSSPVFSRKCIKLKNIKSSPKLTNGYPLERSKHKDFKYATNSS